jgi:hypothetical protein
MGIANIINTAGGGGGGGSEIITNLVNSVDGAGLRLANQGYISCADVSANRFGTNDFSVEFVLSQETASVNADIFISNFNSSNQAVDAAVIRWDVIQNDNIQLVFTNSGATETAYNFGYDPAPDLNEPTHYLVSADRSGNAVLYRNGAEIASVSIAASGSANVGNSGQPTVIGSPVNNFGVKGNVYRLRTYSKALSSDEAKNVFDRADVPTALVSNLLLDLDCAYANPTQSTVIQDRGPNNQDGTLNGTITQTNVIKQLNSTSARIGTTQATPADGVIIADKLGIGIAPSHAATIYGTGPGNATLQIEGEGGADPTVNFLTNNATHWAIGVDDSDSDKFKIVQHSAIGTTNNFFTISSTGEITQTGEGVSYTIKNSDTSLAADQLIGGVAFEKTDGSGAGAGVVGGVRMHSEGSVGESSYLAFSTADSSTNDVERMRITSDGSVGIGTPTPTVGNLQIRDATVSTFALTRTTGNAGASLGIIRFGNTDIDSNLANIVGYQDGAADSAAIAFQTQPTGGTTATRLTIASTGLATFNNGIAFSQTNSTAASNITTTLDHYERGVWTPVIADAATGGNTGSGSTVTGYYERIGNAVTVNGLATNVDTTGLTGSNVLFVRGLPFPAGYSGGTFSNLGRAVGSCVLDTVDVDTSTRSVSAMVTGQNSYFTFHQTRDAVGDSNILVSNLSSGTSDLFFSFTYFAD